MIYFFNFFKKNLFSQGSLHKSELGFTLVEVLISAALAVTMVYVSFEGMVLSHRQQVKMTNTNDLRAYSSLFSVMLSDENLCTYTLMPLLNTVQSALLSNPGSSFNLPILDSSFQSFPQLTTVPNQAMDASSKLRVFNASGYRINFPDGTPDGTTLYPALMTVVYVIVDPTGKSGKFTLESFNIWLSLGFSSTKKTCQLLRYSQNTPIPVCAQEQALYSPDGISWECRSVDCYITGTNRNDRKVGVPLRRDMEGFVDTFTDQEYQGLSVSNPSPNPSKDVCGDVNLLVRSPASQYPVGSNPLQQVSLSYKFADKRESSGLCPTVAGWYLDSGYAGYTGLVNLNSILSASSSLTETDARGLRSIVGPFGAGGLPVSPRLKSVSLIGGSLGVRCFPKGFKELIFP